MSEFFYKEFTYAFTSKGLSAHFAIDKTPDGMFWNLDGAEVRQENALSSRLGRIPISASGGSGNPLQPSLLAPIDKNVHTLSRLKSTNGNTYRYAGANQNLYRRATDVAGPYTAVSGLNQMSGNRFSAATYRPNNSSFPYIFFADSAVMLKDSGTFSALQQWGIFPPIQPMSAAVSSAIVDTPIDYFGTDFNSNPNYPPKLASALNSALSLSIVSISRVAGFVTVTLSGPHNLQSYSAPGGLPRVLITGVGDSSFDGTFVLVSTVPSNVLHYEQAASIPDSTSSGGFAFSFNNTFRVKTTSNGAITGGSINTVTPASMANIVAGMTLAVDPLFGTGGSYEQVFVLTVTATTFTAFFSNNHNPGATLYAMSFSVETESSTGFILGSGPFNLDTLGTGVPGSDSDFLTFGLLISLLSGITSIALQFDVGDGSYTHDYYTINVPLGALINGTWSQFNTTRGAFTKVGNAGLPGKSWANVNSYRILIVSTAIVNVQVADLYFYSSGGPTVGPGSPFDYRYTYFNMNTGDESNPSPVMVLSSFVSPNNQPVTLSFMEPNDPQVTHINIYRRGGTLNVGWTQVAQIPAIPTPPPPVTTITIVGNGITATFPYALGAYVDVFLDADIASNDLLELDNDPPLTTTLPVPVNSFLGTGVSAGSFQWVTPLSMNSIFVNQLITVDIGNSQEVVTVVAVSPTQFLAYFQTSHPVSAIITASTRQGRAVNLVTMAFDQAWFAGDPDNPNRLYYSKTTNPEAVPPENWIEIGTPADPIMGVIFFSGQLFVKTQARIFRVIIPYAGATPTPYPTGSRHGLYASFADCIAEGLLPYLSQDGVYIFTGENSSYSSEVIEWLLADKEPNLGPVPEADPTPAIFSNSIMAFYKNEIFLAYVNKSGVIVRVILDLTAKTWRNDDVDATAMYFEEDTQSLIIGRNNGMVYEDRVGNFDQDINAANVVVTVPINFKVQTPAQDQSLPLNNKVYNELTIDVDFTGQQMDVALLFDDGITVLDLGTFTTNGRQRIPIPINEGEGRLSQNVALRISGAVTGPVHCFNWHIKAATEAEYRETFDSYYIKFGTDHFKIVKQCWVEYIAADPAGINFNVYLEGNMATPIFSFNLPQTLVRKTVRVRFPAFKGTIWRFIATSPSQFVMYGESFVEWKDTTVDSGYQKENFGQMISAQSSV